MVGLKRLVMAVLFCAAFALPGLAAQDAATRLKAVAERVNQTLPRVIDAETRAEKVTVEPGPRFLYHFTLTGANGQTLAKRLTSDAWASELKAKICNAQEMRPLLRTGVTLGYVYKAANGTDVGAVYVTPRECGI